MLWGLLLVVCDGHAESRVQRTVSLNCGGRHVWIRSRQQFALNSDAPPDDPAAPMHIWPERCRGDWEVMAVSFIAALTCSVVELVSCGVRTPQTSLFDLNISVASLPTEPVASA